MKSEYETKLTYIADQAKKLCQKVLGGNLSIDTITLFTHSPTEYSSLKPIIESYGSVSEYSHGKTLYIESDIKIAEESIKLLGLRQPDETRPQVGYADFPVTVEKYKQIIASKNPNTKEIVSGRGEKLIELSHPGFDILGYLAVHD